MAEEGHVLGASPCGKDHGVDDVEKSHGGKKDTHGDPQTEKTTPMKGMRLSNHRTPPTMNHTTNSRSWISRTIRP